MEMAKGRGDRKRNGRGETGRGETRKEMQRGEGREKGETKWARKGFCLAGTQGPIWRDAQLSDVSPQPAGFSVQSVSHWSPALPLVHMILDLKSCRQLREIWGGLGQTHADGLPGEVILPETSVLFCPSLKMDHTWLVTGRRQHIWGACPCPLCSFDFCFEFCQDSWQACMEEAAQFG